LREATGNHLAINLAKFVSTSRNMLRDFPYELSINRNAYE
jgi:hypothetical protein